MLCPDGMSNSNRCLAWMAKAIDQILVCTMAAQYDSLFAL